MTLIRPADVIMTVANAERDLKKGKLAAAVERINYATELYNIFEYHMGHVGIHMFSRYKSAKEWAMRDGRYGLNNEGLLVLLQEIQASSSKF